MHLNFQSLLIVVSLALMFVSCSDKGNKNYAKGSAKLYESFYSGDDGIQYFIKPFDLAENEKVKITADITFRYKKELKDSATINVSIIAPFVVKDLHSLNIKTSTEEAQSGHTELLYNELAKQGYLSRHTVKYALSELRPLFKNPNWNLELESENENASLHSTSSANKIIQQLNAGLFILTD